MRLLIFLIFLLQCIKAAELWGLFSSGGSWENSHNTTVAPLAIFNNNVLPDYGRAILVPNVFILDPTTTGAAYVIQDDMAYFGAHLEPASLSDFINIVKVNLTTGKIDQFPTPFYWYEDYDTHYFTMNFFGDVLILTGIVKNETAYQGAYSIMTTKGDVIETHNTEARGYSDHSKGVSAVDDHNQFLYLETAKFDSKIEFDTLLKIDFNQENRNNETTVDPPMDIKTISFDSKRTLLLGLGSTATDFDTDGYHFLTFDVNSQAWTDVDLGKDICAADIDPDINWSQIDTIYETDKARYWVVMAECIPEIGVTNYELLFINLDTSKVDQNPKIGIGSFDDGTVAWGISVKN